MSRHRSPQGRQGETTFVVDPDGSLSESPIADRLADPESVAGPDTGLLPHPRVSRSGPMRVVGSGPRFVGADDFAAALGLPPLGDPEPPPAADGLGDRRPDRDHWPGHRADPLVPSPRSSPAAAPGGGQDADLAAPAPEGGEPAVPAPRFAPPDAAFQTVTGWRPDEPDLVASGDAKVEWPEVGAAIGEPASAERSDGAARPAGILGWSSADPFSAGRPPASERQSDPWNPGWTSFGDFQPGADPLSDPLGVPLAEHPLGHHRMDPVPSSPAEAEMTADLPRVPHLGEPADAAADNTPERPVNELARMLASAPAGVHTELADQPGTSYGDVGAAPAKPAEQAEGPTAAVAFVPSATFRPAADLDLDADFEPLSGTDDEVDEADDTTVLGSDTPNRQRREPAKRARTARRGRRPSNRLIALAAAAVVLVIVGVTALIGYGKSLWSSPQHAADTHSGAPAPAPAPAPPPGDDAGAKKPADATKKAPPSGDAPDTVMSLANCTKRVGDGASLQQALSSAAPGQKICATGGTGGSRLKITRGGTPSAPITVIGTGSTPVNGITIEASNVIVGGFTMTNPPAPGIQLTGNNITVRNNTVKHPVGDDFDGMRFFGSNLKILNNVITDINKADTDAHADCMQTFATNAAHPTSQNVLIDGNRCERIGSQCLMAEGPNSTAGDGSGVGRSANFTFSNNFCQAGAVQAVKIDDVQNVRLVGNTITGTPHKAFAILNNATGAVVSANKVASNIGYQVGMDSSSRTGYQGPPIGGEE